MSGSNSFALIQALDRGLPIVVMNNVAGAVTFQIEKQVLSVAVGHKLNLSELFTPRVLRNARQLFERLDSNDLIFLQPRR